ncbi:MAG: hypothetical protein ACKVOU_09925, partial [Cytophagales bacterium]
MKHYILLSSILVFLQLNALCQDWNPYHLGNKCFYTSPFKAFDRTINKFQYLQEASLIRQSNDTSFIRLLYPNSCMRNFILRNTEQYDKKDLYTYSDTLLVIKDTSIFKYQYLGKTKYFKFNIKSI